MRFTNTNTVQFLTYDVTTDTEGFPLRQERLLGSVPAAIEWKAATDKWANNTVLVDASAIVRLRMPPFEVTTKTIMVLGSERFNIVSVDNVRSRDRWLVLVVKEVPHGSLEG